MYLGAQVLGNTVRVFERHYAAPDLDDLAEIITKHCPLRGALDLLRAPEKASAEEKPSESKPMKEKEKGKKKKRKQKHAKTGSNFDENPFWL